MFPGQPRPNDRHGCRTPRLRSCIVAAEDTLVPFAELSTTDLHLETVYLGGNRGNMSDEPLARLVGVGNQGGFRYKGSPVSGRTRLVVLYTTGTEVDWPDELDPQSGIFTYYGDNRAPGRQLHDTRRYGNLILRDAFDATHGSPENRRGVPPFLLFEKVPIPGRAVRFRGLLAPGAATLTPDDDLVAIWRNRGGLRFQNYRARFSVLDVASISRTWIDSLLSGAPSIEGCPPEWARWVEARAYTTLEAPSITTVRSKADQQPVNDAGREILRAIYHHFSGRPHDFEECAVAIWRLIAPATTRCDVTRPSRDGGRDAVGVYSLGPANDTISLEFALEAKCYAETTSVGVRDVSRLISRIRHRQFGVFVTLSHFDRQVYREVRDDEHPIALVCGRDIVEVLRSRGIGTVADARAWLDSGFPERRRRTYTSDIARPQVAVDVRPRPRAPAVRSRADQRQPGTAVRRPAPVAGGDRRPPREDGLGPAQ